MRGMGQGLSDHHMVLCKVRLVGPSIKRREVVVGAISIKSEKLRKDQYRDMLDLLRGKRVEGDGNNVKHMWEQVKWAMVESAREGCYSVRVERKNPKSVW